MASTRWTPTSNSASRSTPASTRSPPSSSSDLGVRSVRLLTNNPAKVDALAAHGFGVTRTPLPPQPTPDNLRYLATKRHRLGHQIA